MRWILKNCEILQFSHQILDINLDSCYFLVMKIEFFKTRVEMER